MSDTVHPLLTLMRNEWRLSWRGLVDFLARRGGSAKPGSSIFLILLILMLVTLAHGIAYALTLTAAPLLPEDPASLVRLTATLAFAFLLMMSAGLDSAAFTLYSRSDYELLFSSPIPPRSVFIIRAFNIFIFTGAKVFLYGAPFLNVMAVKDGPHWLFGYAILAGMAALATLTAVATAMLLVAIAGIKRTRLIAQLLAAFVGLGVFLLLQRDFLMPQSLKEAGEALLLSMEPSFFASPIFWPAMALLGDGGKALAVLAAAVLVTAAGLYALAAPFYRASIAAAGAPVEALPLAKPRAVIFGAPPFRALISKSASWCCATPGCSARSSRNACS